jgi:hypothetical protein
MKSIALGGVNDLEPAGGLSLVCAHWSAPRRPAADTGRHAPRRVGHALRLDRDSGPNRTAATADKCGYLVPQSQQSA